ncbi:hypothetical protein ACIHQR_08800 [Corallococcus coralloides]|uniref:hypothetical protein n=1 Tax=Corallococcus TaxID=83461 RepID=UPI001CBE83A5|nr:hypothetical protein [Corallococcus sp. AS-1-12]MBZ4331365.1 hypothetical protein [Corallococcus sp. AS-1-12]
MHGWVCAFCERGLGEDRRGDVEHFRPKSAAKEATHNGYWWLAYEFENYLLSCSTCNSSHKRTLFPLEQGASHVDFNNRNQIHNEARLFIDPTVDPVADWLTVEIEDENNLCEIKPTTTDSTGKLRATHNINQLQLNEEVKLIQQRRRKLESAQKDYIHRDFLNLLEQASHFRPHGSTVRAFLRIYAPEIRLPSKEDDLLVLLTDTNEELNEYSRQKKKGLHPSERHFNELLWMLAVIWKHPPALDADAIELWLYTVGWRPQVFSLYRQL